MMSEIALLTDILPEPFIRLRAGDLTVMYERGNLRYIRFRNTEIVRMIYGALRTEDWNTIIPHIHSETIERDHNSFTIKYTAVYETKKNINDSTKDVNKSTENINDSAENINDSTLPVHYSAEYLIQGFPDSSVIFSMKGRALSEFKSNRIGLCIHHPVKEMTGVAVTIYGENETGGQYHFPDQVSPNQPFTGIQQMILQHDNIGKISLSMQGSIFETEDQRNWSDNSFKTYSPPLSFPRTVTVHAGDELKQEIRLWVETKHEPDDRSAPPMESDDRNDYVEEKIKFPRISFGRPKSTAPLPGSDLNTLKKCLIELYRVRLNMTQNDQREKFNQALEESKELGIQMELIVEFDSGLKAECDELLSMLSGNDAIVYSILILQHFKEVTPEDLISMAYFAIKSKFPRIVVGYGTSRFFAELNRQPPAATDFDFVAFSLSPQIHAFDTRSILENLQAQSDILHAAKKISGGKPVHISPVTFNSGYTNQVNDERNNSWLQAYWFLITLGQLGEGGVVGLFDLDATESFFSAPVPEQSPFYIALKTIKDFNPSYIVKRFSKDRALISPGELLLENNNGQRLLFKGPEEYISFY